MKTNFFYSAFLAFLMSGVITTQRVTAQTDHSSFLEDKGLESTELKSEQKKTAPLEGLKVAPAAPALFNEQPFGASMKDTILLSQADIFIDDKIQSCETFDYDEYGYLRMSNYGKDEASLTPKCRYKYVLGPDNYWITRQIECKKEDGTWYVSTKVERDINNKKQLLGIRQYSANSEGELKLDVEKVYDYSHRSLHGQNGNGQVGALVGYKSYKDGQPYIERKYEWMESVQEYIQTYDVLWKYDRDGKLKIFSKKEAEIKGEEVVERRYDFDKKAHNLYLFVEEHSFHGYNDGNYAILYRPDGTLDQRIGAFRIVEKDTPEDGYITRSMYRFVNDQLVLQEKLIKSGVDEKTSHAKGDPYYYYQEIKNKASNSMAFNIEKDGEWLNDTIASVWVRLPNGMEVESFEYNPKYKGYLPIYYDNLCHQFVVRNSKRKDHVLTSYMKYYNLDNTLTKTIKCVSYDNEAMGTKIEPTTYSILEGDKWKPLRHLESIYVPDCSDAYIKFPYDPFPHIVNEYDKKGVPLITKRYSIVGGKETLTSKTVYTYNDDGIVSDTYDYVVDGIFLEDKYRHTFYECKQISEDEKMVTRMQYSPDGEVTDASRSVRSKDIWSAYKYNKDTKEFEYSHSGTCNLITYDEKTGLKTTIKRKLNESDEIVNIRKIVEKHVDAPYFKHVEYYDWDEVEEEWIGLLYEESWGLDFSIDYKFSNPKAYDDTGNNLQMVAKQDFAIKIPEICRNKKTFVWNPERKDWDLNYFVTYALLGHYGNTYVVKKESGSLHETNTETYTMELDNDGYVLHMERVLESTDKAKECRDTYDYTYNDWKYLTCEIFDREKSGHHTITKYDYHYKDVHLIPTVVSNVKGEELIEVTGRNIVVPAGALVEVYDMVGRKVKSGKGQLTLPAAGLYVVKSGAHNVKVSCR